MPGEHPVYHRRRGDPEPAAQAQPPGEQLDGAGEQQDRPEHGHPVGTHQFEDQHREAGRRAADL